MDSRNGAPGSRGKEVGGGGAAPEALTDRTASLALAVVLLLVFLAYLDTLWFQFVYDDRYQIVENTWLRSWHYLPRYFTADVWAFRRPTSPGNYYRPLFLLWFRLQYMAFGLRPWAWHLCTVLMHLGVTALVYHLAVRLLKDRLAGLFAALIFGLHPIHAEAVAWVSGVTEPLLAILLIPSFLFYLRKRSEPSRARAYLASSLGFYILAMLAKETALILPGIIFGNELILSGAEGRSATALAPTKSRREPTCQVLRALAVTAPYFVASGAYLGLRMIALHGFQNPRERHSFLSMVLTWPSVGWFYIRHLAWPVGLGPFYDMRFVVHPTVGNFLLPAIMVSLVIAALWIGAKTSRRIALAILWLVLPILPVLDLRAFPQDHLARDRYLYLPSVGLAMLVGLGLCRLQIAKADAAPRRYAPLALAALLAAVLVGGVTHGTAYFADQVTFYTHLASMSARGDIAKLNLGGLLGESGHLDEAIKLYQEVWRSDPNSWEVNYNLGYAYYLQGKLPDAERYLTRAIELDSSRPESFFYLGLTKLKMGDVDAAAANVQRAIAIRPDAVHYHFALGVILRLQGNLPGALSEFRTELELDPDNAAARQQAAEIEAARGGGQPATPSGSKPTPFTSPRP